MKTPKEIRQDTSFMLNIWTWARNALADCDPCRITVIR
jgi:hypothetical protein